MLVIGDVHGKYLAYDKLIKSTKESIQLGDFGFKTQHDWFLNYVNFENHKIVFGNHDYYPYLNKEHSLGNFSFIEKYNLFTVRGADSIDKWRRKEGLDWFRNEELNYKEFDECITLYEKLKPEIVISHDVPQIIREEVFGIQDKSITSNALGVMFQIHQPKIWLFGHHHKSIKTVMEGTEFICLNELETYNI